MLKYFLCFSIVLLLLSCSQIRRLPEVSSARISSLPESWNEELEAAAGDTLRLPEVEGNIRREAAWLSNHYDDPQCLFLSWQGYLLLPEREDSLRAKQIKDKIRNRYPQSQENYQLASQDFYDRIYPVWTNDSLKVVIITELLAAYPETGWRRVMYPYLTYSLYNLDEWEKLQQVLADFRLEYPRDYLPFLQTARYFLRRRQDLEFALENARQALKKSYNYPRQPFVASEQWFLEERAATVVSTETLAAILNRLEKYEVSRDSLLKVINYNKLGTEDETTLGGCYYHLACAFQGLGEHDSAAKAAIEALVQGDSRGYYTGLADSLLRELLPVSDSRSLLAQIREIRDYSGPVFTDVTADYGLQEIAAGRVAWGDYDNDGYQDLLLNGSRLFRNWQGGYFREVTDSLFTSPIRGNGGIWGDFNNDGLLDIVTKDPEALWLQSRDGFHDSGWLPDNLVPTEGLAAGDVNGDGRLDIYLANYEHDGMYEHDQLFRGDPVTGLVEETADRGLLPDDQKPRAGRGVNMGDYDDDGDLDIFVSNYRLTENFLWRNDGNGYFQNVAREAGVSGVEVDGWWGHTIGSEWGDYDNDGDFDLITANLAHPRYIDFSDKTMLCTNSGPPAWQFRDTRSRAGIRFEETHSEPAWGDVNNDGFLDLYLNDVYEGRRSFLYLNKQNGTFQDITCLAGVRHYNGWGAAYADIDNDGDLDLLAAGGRIQLFRNDTPRTGNWLEIKVIGNDHVDAIGTRLELYNQDFLQVREIQGGKGTTSQHSLIQHFGLGVTEHPLTLKVRFPSGLIKTLMVTDFNQIVLVREDD